MPGTLLFYLLFIANKHDIIQNFNRNIYVIIKQEKYNFKRMKTFFKEIIITFQQKSIWIQFSFISIMYLTVYISIN